MDFEKLKILEGKFWKVFLHQDQTSIGKIYFWYNGSEQDLLEIPEHALLEFEKLGRKMKSALDKTFKPDLYNYLSLNNLTVHLHIHMIPRYSKKIDFSGTIFQDVSFGKPYKPNPDFKLDEEILAKIKEKILENLK